MSDVAISLCQQGRKWESTLMWIRDARGYGLASTAGVPSGFAKRCGAKTCLNHPTCLAKKQEVWLFMRRPSCVFARGDRMYTL